MPSAAQLALFCHVMRPESLVTISIWCGLCGSNQQMCRTRRSIGKDITLVRTSPCTSNKVQRSDWLQSESSCCCYLAISALACPPRSPPVLERHEAAHHSMAHLCVVRRQHNSVPGKRPAATATCCMERRGSMSRAVLLVLGPQPFLEVQGLGTVSDDGLLPHHVALNPSLWTRDWDFCPFPSRCMSTMPAPSPAAHGPAKHDHARPVAGTTHPSCCFPPLPSLPRPYKYVFPVDGSSSATT